MKEPGDYSPCAACGRPSGGEQYCARCERKAEDEAAAEAERDARRGSIAVGDVLVFSGTPERPDPYLWTLDPRYVSGPARMEALEAFANGEGPDGFEFWYATARGGAREITDPNEIDWKTSGIPKPVMKKHYMGRRQRIIGSFAFGGAGLAAICYAAGWVCALGVFLIMWAHHIEKHANE